MSSFIGHVLYDPISHSMEQRLQIEGECRTKKKKNEKNRLLKIWTKKSLFDRIYKKYVDQN